MVGRGLIDGENARNNTATDVEQAGIWLNCLRSRGVVNQQKL